MNVFDLTGIFDGHAWLTKMEKTLVVGKAKLTRRKDNMRIFELHYSGCHSGCCAACMLCSEFNLSSMVVYNCND